MFSPLALTTRFRGTRARGKTKGEGVRQRNGIHTKSVSFLFTTSPAFENIMGLNSKSR